MYLEFACINTIYCNKIYSSDNYIDGTDLTEDEVKATVPPLGLHRKILRLLLNKVQNERTSIYFFYVYKNVFFVRIK